MRSLLASALIALCPVTALAKTAGEGEFAYASELSDRGFVPFATSSVGGASFGMTDGSDLYLCFIADSPLAQAARQQVLVDEISGKGPDRVVPNIPIVCVLTH